MANREIKIKVSFDTTEALKELHRLTKEMEKLNTHKKWWQFWK